jgi:transketolase
LSTATGITLAGRLQQRDYMTFVLLGDGEMHEGQIWEAALAAAHHQLGNLIAIIDRNDYSLDGRIADVTNIEPLADKWIAFGWEVHEVGGHDVPALLALLRALRADGDRDRPVAVIAKTVKGKGISYMEANFGWHLGWLADQDELNAIAELKATL